MVIERVSALELDDQFVTVRPINVTVVDTDGRLVYEVEVRDDGPKHYEWPTNRVVDLGRDGTFWTTDDAVETVYRAMQSGGLISVDERRVKWHSIGP